jgi:Cu(I)/Ag(I) efflux system protein CusF
MKRIALTLVAVGVTGALAACSQTEATTETAAAPAPAPAAPASDMRGMAMGADEKIAKGSGAVTAVDATAGVVTIDHGPIPEANWPAMTMGFKAPADIARQLKAGDKIDFDLKIKDGAGEITAVRKP